MARALVKLNYLVNSSLSFEKPPPYVDEDVQSALQQDSYKVYTTLLKTRFALEHCLIRKEDLAIIADWITTPLESQNDQFELAAFSLRRFLLAVTDLAFVSIISMSKSKYSSYMRFTSLTAKDSLSH